MPPVRELAIGDLTSLVGPQATGSLAPPWLELAIDGNRILGTLDRFGFGWAQEPADFRIVNPDTVNLTTGTFLTALTSQHASVRDAARMYLLGVEDTTEGRSWCSYRRWISPL